MKMETSELIIEAGRAEKQYWRGIWHYRELFYFLAWRDILVRIIYMRHSPCTTYYRSLSGGSGADLWRQRESGSDILEKIWHQGKSYAGVAAKSQLYAGVHGHKKQRFHSFLQIQVQPNKLNKLSIFPFVVSQSLAGWQTKAIKPLEIGRLDRELSAVTTEKAL